MSGVHTYVNPGETLHGVTITGFKTDAVRLNGDGASLIGCKITDTLATDEAHRDMCQLKPNGTTPNAQMMGASSSFNHVSGNTMRSERKAQGAFSSDGGFFGITVQNNIIQTKSTHKVTIAGVMSGIFKNNVDDRGIPVRVLLDNWRFGGGLKESFWVTSFANHEYKAVMIDSNTYLDDRRGLEHRRGQNYVSNFDLDRWVEITQQTKYDHGEFRAHFIMVKSKYESEKLNYNSPTMVIKDGTLFVPDRLKMSERDHAFWNDRWEHFKPYEVDSDQFDIILDVYAFDMLHEVRREYGKPMRLTNAHRNYEHNRRVRGKPNSDHTFNPAVGAYSTAYDIALSRPSDGQRFDDLLVKYGFNAIGRYPRSRFIHGSMRKPKPSGKLYRWGRKW